MDALLLAADTLDARLIAQTALRHNIAVETVGVEEIASREPSESESMLVLTRRQDVDRLRHWGTNAHIVATVDDHLTSWTDGNVTAENGEPPDVVVGMRVHAIRDDVTLAEVTHHPDSPAGHTNARRLAQQLIDWKLPAVVAKRVPGQIMDRILYVLFLEAMRLHEEGIFSLQETDLLMMSLGRWCTGPFAYMDKLGLELVRNGMVHSYQQRRQTPPPVPMLDNLIDRGACGEHAGQGFYLHDAHGLLPACTIDRQNFTLTPLLEGAIVACAAKCDALDAAPTEHYALARLQCTLINEAAWIFDEGHARSDAIDLAWQGLGFAMGPLQWADQIGHRTVRGVLLAMNDALGVERYRSAKLFDA
ncbi:MAG: 3-hydroxyacyl-CoA dehydrogenase family protein [Phycisphaerae bacterium]